MTVESSSRSISMKVWDRTGIKFATPGSAVRHVTDCCNGPGMYSYMSIVVLTLCIRETPKRVLLQTVKAKMKCSSLQHFIRVYTVF